MEHSEQTVSSRAVASHPERPDPPRDRRDWFDGYEPIVLVALLTFLLRYVLAARNSYWLDELYSVERYVLQYESVRAAISDLADTSIHPPLYQFLLYFWIEFFGHGEAATRTLSNLYVTLSVIFLHRTVALHFGTRLANATALAFALTYAVTFYGLETRSYAQTLALSTISSYGLLLYLMRRPGTGGGRELTFRRIWPAALLSVANIGLMLTHYYNFFFWGAQIAFVTGYVLIRDPGRRIRTLTYFALLYLAQLIVFAAIWGRTTLESYRRNTGRFSAESVSYTPLEMLRRATDQSFTLGPFNTTIVLLAAAAILAYAAWRLWPARYEADALRVRRDGLAYLLVVTVGPTLIAYTAFLLVQAERFNVRYVLFVVPGLTILLAIAAREALVGVRGFLEARLPKAEAIRHPVVPFAATIILVTLIVVPGTLSAARYTKDDWRGVAQDMVAIVESNPDWDYIIYEPAFRSTPVYNYYLSRYSDDVRVEVTIRRGEERRGEDFSFERTADLIEEHDFLIIPFVHHRTTNFPIALGLLEDRYDIHHWQINDDNKGIVIFDVRNPATP